MKTLTRISELCGAALLTFATGAGAAVYTFDLSGNPDEAFYQEGISGSFQLKLWMLFQWRGFSPPAPITADAGDVFHITYRLETPVAVQAGSYQTIFTFGFDGYSGDYAGTETVSNTRFFLGDTLQKEAVATTMNGLELRGAASFMWPESLAFSFDRIETTFEVTSVEVPVTIDGPGRLVYEVLSPVPEPNTALLWLLGSISFIARPAMQRAARQLRSKP